MTEINARDVLLAREAIAFFRAHLQFIPQHSWETRSGVAAGHLDHLEKLVDGVPVDGNRRFLVSQTGVAAAVTVADGERRISYQGYRVHSELGFDPSA